MRSQSLSGPCVSLARLPNNHTSSGASTSTIRSMTPVGRVTAMLIAWLGLAVPTTTSNLAKLRTRGARERRGHRPDLGMTLADGPSGSSRARSGALDRTASRHPRAAPRATRRSHRRRAPRHPVTHRAKTQPGVLARARSRLPSQIGSAIKPQLGDRGHGLPRKAHI